MKVLNITAEGFDTLEQNIVLSAEEIQLGFLEVTFGKHVAEIQAGEGLSQEQ